MANQNLPGGRAYYTGKNAYASQAFELDTRRQLQMLQHQVLTLQSAVTSILNTLTSRGTYVEAIVTAGTIGSWASDAVQNITSIALTEGVWVVSGYAHWSWTASGTAAATRVGINTVSAVLPAVGAPGRASTPTVPISGVGHTLIAPSLRVIGPTTVYLPASINFTAGIPLAGGTLYAWRMA